MTKDKRHQYDKRYRENNKDKIKQYRSGYDKTAQGKFNRIKQKAKSRKLQFELDFKDYENEFFQKQCWYCGRISIGIDRIDSNLGYLNNNMRPCCEQCNQAKLDYTEEEFIQMCMLVSERYGK